MNPRFATVSRAPLPAREEVHGYRRHTAFLAIAVAILLGLQPTQAQNSPPTITSLSDVAIAGLSRLPQMLVTVSDPESPVTTLVLSAESSNPSVVSSTGITFVLNHSLRGINITPSGIGEAVITIRVTDPDGASASNRFTAFIGPLTFLRATPTRLAFTSSAWVDYDNDRDLDLFITGQDSNEGFPALWLRNDGGRLTETVANLPGGIQGSCAWGDIDGDGLVDAALSGLSFPYAFHTKVFRNLGAGQFGLVTNLTGLGASSMAWGDYDNDGDLDLVTIGLTIGGGHRGTIYRNNGNLSFTQTAAYVPAVAYGGVAWGDLDLDGDLDLIVVGTPSNFPAEALAQTLRNDGNDVFTLRTNALAGVMDGGVALGDFDNDGDFDVGLTGQLRNGNSAARIYRNEGAFVFSPAYIDLGQQDHGAAAWGDYDGDDAIDFISNGYYGTRLHHNQGGQFLAAPGLVSAALGHLAWGDYDGDGDLDFMLSGWTNGTVNEAVLIYTNQTPTSAWPVAPQSLSADVNGLRATLRWHRTTDASQPGARTYNVRVGRTPGGHEVLSGMADSATGFRRIAAHGNAGSSTNYSLLLRSEGVYYWSVQALNHAFVSSSFASEQTFVINSAPQVSPIANLIAPLGIVSTQLQFTVSDVLTPSSNLVLQAESSHTNLVSNSGFTFSRNGSNVTLVIQPAPEVAGTSIITVRAVDEQGAVATRQFQFTLFNTPPFFSSLATTQFLSYVDSSMTVPFAIGDSNSPATSLVVTGESWNTSVLLQDGIAFSGTGTNRTVTFTPLAGQQGRAPVSLTVFDLQGASSTRLIHLIVTNLPPFIGPLPNVSHPPGAPFLAVPFMIGDYESAANALAVTAGSSNPELVGPGSIVFSGAGSNRLATIQLPANAVGVATITFTVTDPIGGASSRSFELRLEDFTELPMALPGLSDASAAWGDYDNDGDADLLLCGTGFTGTFTRLYRNEAGTNLVDAMITFPGVVSGSCAWTDYDGDGWLDIARSISSEIRIERNNGNGTFTLAYQIPLGSTIVTALDFADYDHDADADILMALRPSFSAEVIRIYRLDSASGIASFASFIYGSAQRGTSWGDFNVDGSPDILAVGSSPPILRNTLLGTSFQTVAVPVYPVSKGAGAWADFDNDGDLDFALSGSLWAVTNYAAQTRLFRNDGVSGFVEANAGLLGLHNGDLAWGDFDNDGWVDLVLTGNANVTGPRDLKTFTYRNLGDGIFALRTNTLPGAHGAALGLADFDNDGRTDILLSGSNITGRFTRLFRNNALSSNTVPFAPSNLSAVVTNNTATLSWAGGADAEQAGGLSYNIQLGTNAGKTLMPSLADPGTGWRRVPRSGNVGSVGTRYFTNLLPGIYTWSVQSIDHSRAGSPFAPKHTFIITNRIPTISGLANRVLPWNQIASNYFTVSDFETSGSELVVTAASSDTNLALVRVSGTGASSSRLLTMTPAGTGTGPVTITVTVRDIHGGISTSSLELLLTAAAPVISSIPNVITTFNTSTSVVFSVWDPDTSADAITLTAISSNTNIIPNANIVLGGSGSNRTVTVTPATNRHGIVSISLVATDPSGGSSLASSFFVTILNYSPAISTIANRTVLPGSPPFTVSFTIDDVETPSSNLVVTARAGASNLVESIQLGGASSNRQATIALFTNALVGDSITLTVTDAGGSSSSSTFNIYVEVFSPATNTGLPNLSATAMAWGDYDRDGDQDLVLSGIVEFGPSHSGIYRNDGGVFSLATNVLSAAGHGLVDWVDFDNDGDLDVPFINSQIGRILRNDGQGAFTSINVGLPAMNAANMAWADYDGDGRRDLLVVGNNAIPFTRLFRNQQVGTFSEVATAFPGTTAGMGAWGDYDADGDPDLALGGVANVAGTNEGPRLVIFRNERGQHFFPMATLAPTYFTSLEWFDLENDGDLDLAVIGMTQGSPSLSVYRNDGGIFTALSLGVSSAQNSGLATGDFDNDGWVDIASMRYSSGVSVAQSSGGGPFRQLPFLVGPYYDLLQGGLLRWGDYDNDGDLDLLGSGRSAYSYSRTILYRNNCARANTPPTPPSGLAASSDLSNRVTLTWLASNDAETTNPGGLHYNLRVGTTPGGTDIISPEAENNGSRLVTHSGNTRSTPAAFEDLPRGEYFWSVQAIDSAFTGSPFAVEETFSITNERPTLSPIPDQLLLPGRPSSAIPFTIGDLETPPDEVVLSFASSDSSLISESMTSFTRAGSNVVLVLTPGTERGGVATITLTAQDAAGATRSRSFDVTVEIFSLVTNLPPWPSPMAAWIDSDSDGDLDLFITAGIPPSGWGSTQGSVLWRNDSGTNFFALPAGPLAVVEGAAAWADFKGKGRIDLLLTGRLSPHNYPFSALYTNSGSNTFVEVMQFQPLPDVWNSAADAGDFDNDGSPDLVIAGQTYNPEVVARIYRNRNGTFSSTDSPFPGIHSGAALWADYDNDADLDLFITGGTNVSAASAGLARLYRNEDGTNFVDVQAAFPQLSSSAAGWADFDHDGDLDLALSGWDGINGVAGIFRNAAGVFSDIGAGLRGVSGGEITWGDFTGDGWTDLLLTGSTNQLPSGANTVLYRNNRNGTFSEMPCNLPPIWAGSAVCGDYDRDGDLDVCLVGKGQNDWTGAVFRNNSPLAPSAPAAPHGLTAAVNGRAVELNWTPSTNFSASHVASYNLRVGTMPSSPDVMPPHSLTNGSRQLARWGNAGPAPHWKLRGLMPGIYYWSVQAIGDSFAASPFSAEGTFTITNTRPIATPLSFTLAEDSVLGLTLAGVDAESAELTYAIVDQTTNGLLTGFSPFFTYRPQSNYFGADSFTFMAQDGLTNSEPALVTLNITPMQDTATLHLLIHQLPGGAREFDLVGEPSALHVIESSQDLSQWSPVMTVRAAATGRVTFTVAPHPDKQFYRVRPTLP